MYGPSSGDNAGRGGDGGRGGGRPRQFTPKGQMAGAENAKSAIMDLPPHMAMMFEARPLPMFFPKDKKKPYPPYAGVSSLLKEFETTPAPPRPLFEPPAERKRRIRREMAALHAEKVELLASDWDPHSNPKATGDAFCTLFVSRLSYDTNEKKLRREFEQYGPIKSLRLVTDNEGKSRGYAFIEFEREEHLKLAFKEADRKKIDGKRVIVDVERGRTVRNWRPARLGGGLGGRKALKSRRDIEYENAKAALAASTAVTSSAGAYGRREEPRSRPPETPRAADNRYGPGDSSRAAAPARNRSRSRDRADRDRGDRGDRRGNSRDRGSDRDRRGRSRDRGGGGGDRDRDSYYSSRR